jgi:hemolysin D
MNPAPRSGIFGRSRRAAAEAGARLAEIPRRLAHYRAVWRASVEEEKGKPKLRRNRDEREFLPAALEVLETPASPAARAVMLTIVAVIVVALAWSIFGTVDTVAIAGGKIIPSSHTKVIQAFEIGVVRAIHVHDGQAVRKGDVLIELDPGMTAADRDRMARELVAARLDVARLSAMMKKEGDALASFRPPPDATPVLVATSRIVLRDRLAEYHARLAGIEGETRRLKARYAGTKAQIEKLEATIPLLAERVAAREHLAARQYGTRASYLELKQSLIEMKGDLAVARLSLDEAAQAIRTQEDKRRELVAGFSAQAYEDISKALQHVGAIEKDLAKAEDRQRLKTLRAPVSGIVQQLAVHTVGGVVNPAEPLMAIVPHDSVLEVEAMVLNKDIGFVRKGQPVAVKVESFPFTRYGIIHGVVANVSSDAIQDKDKGLVYSARVALRDKRILVGDRWIALGPGMSVTAEIKTGERHVIEYFLSPFLRYTDEAMRER